MNDGEKRKEQLIRELAEIRQRMAELNRSATQSKLAEEELVRSEERYRNLIELSPDMIALHSQGKYVYVNPAGIKMLGASGAEELIGKPTFETIHPDCIEMVKDRTRQLMQGKAVPLVEEKYIRMDGKIVDVEVAAAPIPSQGEPMIQVIARDISERKRMEAALQKSEGASQRIAQENAIIADIGRIISSTLNINDVYNQFAEAVRNLIPFDRISINILNPEDTTFSIPYAAGLDAAGRKKGDVIPLAGTAAEEVMRTRSSLLIGKLEEFVSRFPGLLPLLQAGFESMMLVPLTSQGLVIGILNLQLSKPRSYNEQDLKLAENIGTQIAGTIASAQLYNERRQAGEILGKSEEKAKRLSRENAVMAEIGRIISSTLDIEEVYERFAQEVQKLIPVDRCVFTVINSEEQTATTSYASGLEIPGRLLGEVFPLGGSATEKAKQAKSGLIIPTEDENEVAGQVPGLLPVFRAGIRSVMMIPLISRDQVIGILNLQAMKPKAYNKKDLVIAERIGHQIAGAIANAQLYNERKRAQEEKASLEEQLGQSQKMEAIGRLAGGVAHDFNNLLTVINSNSQLALMELREWDPLREKLDSIQKAGERAANLTRQLLAFSRRQVVEMKVIDLNALLQDLGKMLLRVIGEDIELKIVPGNGLGRVKVDPGQLEQAILNLVVNARDAMPSGGKLTLETANTELDQEYSNSHLDMTPGRYVMLSVTDTGVGMVAEVREHIFEPFFTTKEKGKGTGLGLSTVYGVVKQSGGNIWVYSEPGHGTTCKVYLPQVDEPLEDARKKGGREKLPGGNETILVVEDEEEVRKLAVAILKRQGYRILEAAHGGDAFLICELEEERIHLLLTDIVMPEMNGPELARRLQYYYPEMRVLFMSGYTDNAILQHGMLDKEIFFLQKPFSVDGLVGKVREVLDN